MVGLTNCTRSLTFCRGFGMADEQGAAWLEPGQHVVHHAPFGFHIEVNHHIAQEDHVKTANIGQWRQQIGRQEEPGG